jgi:peptidoglycan/xylan/chitin deacetylase (PgdA/CDA1 family)
MYHSISGDPEPGVSEYFRVNTSPELFRRHMHFLREEGYQVVDLEAAVQMLRTELPGASKRVVVTFDDGFADFYDNAFPILEECGFTATVFLPTGFIGDPRRHFGGRECLSWVEVLELHAAGIHFGSHTINHPVLTELAWKDVEREIRISKDELEQRLGSPVKTFAYPFAFPQADQAFVELFEQLLGSAGYACGVSTTIGFASPGDSIFTLKRLPVNSEDDSLLFQAKLEGAYNWLAVPQILAKKSKHYLSSLASKKRTIGGLSSGSTAN